MRVRLVLLAVALLLGGGALYVWHAGLPSPGSTQAGKAETAQRVADAAAEESASRTVPASRALPADDKPGGSAVARVTVTPVRKSEVPI